jgi:hypothetical protein
MNPFSLDHIFHRSLFATRAGNCADHDSIHGTPCVSIRYSRAFLSAASPLRPAPPRTLHATHVWCHPTCIAFRSPFPRVVKDLSRCIQRRQATVFCGFPTHRIRCDSQPLYSTASGHGTLHGTPCSSVAFVTAWLRRHAPLVGLVRVELTTSRLSGVRSNHLSYRPRC